MVIISSFPEHQGCQTRCLWAYLIPKNGSIIDVTRRFRPVLDVWYRTVRSGHNDKAYGLNPSTHPKTTLLPGQVGAGQGYETAL